MMTLHDSLHRKFLKSGPTIGLSILTRSLWPKNMLLSWNTTLIHQIWLPVTSCSLQN